MPRPLAKDPQTGRFYTVDPKDGQWRPLTDMEYGNLRPSAVLDEMGVDPGERFVIKNFLNPGMAEMFLRSRGYEVLKYGSGLNFAVRKNENEPWKVLDPDKGGIGEFFRDVADVVIGDIALPTIGATAGAAAGGLPGAMVGSAAAEGVRQAIGQSIAGDSGGSNFDPLQIGIAGASAGAGAAVGAALRPVGRVAQAGAQRLAHSLEPTGALSRAAETVLSRLTKIREASGLRVYDITSYRQRQGVRPFLTPADVLDISQIHMGEVAGKRIETAVANRDAMLGGKTVNMRSVIEKWLRKPGAPEKDLTLGLRRVGRAAAGGGRVAPEEIDLTSEISALFGAPTWQRAAANAPLGASKMEIKAIYDQMIERWLTEMETVPANIAARVRTHIQRAVAEAGAYKKLGIRPRGSVKPMSDKASADLTRFVGEWKEAFHADLDSQGFGRVRQLDDYIHRLARARDELRIYLHADRTTGEKALMDAFAPGREYLIRAIKEYDAAFPGNQWYQLAQRVAIPQAAASAPHSLESQTFETFVGGQFSPRIGRPELYGLPQIIAPPTATGAPLGLAFTTSALGALTGGAVSGLPGAVAGGAVGGFLAFSPSALIKVAPWFVRGGQVIQSGARSIARMQAPPLVGPASAAAAAASLASLGRSDLGKTVVRQESREKPRKAVFVGESLPR